MNAPPPLQLKHYFFTRICIEAFPPPKDEKDKAIRAASRIDTKIEKMEEENHYHVIVEVVLAGEENSYPPPYVIDIQAVGQFKVRPDWPEADKEKLVTITGSSILYGAIREQVLSITSRGPNAPLMLPTISFRPKQEEKPAETPKPKRKTRKKPFAE